MKTLDGFTTKRCSLIDNEMWIEGENYPIKALRKNKNFRPILYLVGILLILYPLGFHFFFHKFQAPTSPWEYVVYIVFSISVILGFYTVYITSTYVRTWTANGTNLIFIEPYIDLEAEDQLQELSKKLPRNLNREHTYKKSIFKVVSVSGTLLIFFIGFFFYYLFTGNISSENFVPLVVVLFSIRGVYEFSEKFSEWKWYK